MFLFLPSFLVNIAVFLWQFLAHFAWLSSPQVMPPAAMVPRVPRKLHQRRGIPGPFRVGMGWKIFPRAAGGFESSEDF